jgi:Icc-related predicted phosphoesterase
VKILALADEEVSFIHSPTVRDRFADVDLIVSCGDLPASYLEYVVTLLNKPLVYVPGNHDPDHLVICGGVAIDGRVSVVNGLRMLGLGGSRRYKADGRHQYTEREMRWRIITSLPNMWRRTSFRRQRMDLIISHAPPRGVHDADDLVHTGFNSFHWLIRVAKPHWFLHGHCHTHRNLLPSVTRIDETQVVNVFPYRLVEVQG